MGALGRAARVETPLVFCTELAAFFAARGTVQFAGNPTRFFGFERTVFGIVHVRTQGLNQEGEQVLRYERRILVKKRSHYPDDVAPAKAPGAAG